ncbi:MAG: choline/ethanolamine kinase family protein [Alphaproteobacteria bacterium]|jgi:thiamine kinase-like enzyme
MNNSNDPVAIAAAKAASLACWSGPVDPQPLTGGLTNLNFVIEDGRERFVVRVADDIPIHGIMRFNELAASRAAHAAGVSPEVVHAEPGALVLRFIDGETFGEAEVRQANLEGRILPLLRRVHDDMPKYYRGPLLAFWVFQSMRGYGIVLREGNSRMVGELPRFTAINDELEAAVGSIRLVFGHNDLLAANFMDDGKRLWLIDWDYAGLNSPLFDLANLASNNGFSEAEEDRLLEAYYEATVSDELRRQFKAMKCASLLREAMWSMVSEIHLTIDVDYVAYTAEYLARFEAAYADFQEAR